eukprot:gnl/TRDRNA2_/TRDRNA2_88400_c1_seq1.p1 gnl/TRDRNA2_/TRDRNA2_88400_c1~~gnl/TRDRNA2_/TRDRNA2_88400_c1_seq1.p1  ORF type:complete len:257 (-),score=64.79 gnl/TRDRNA2_/TRDRNA2_88400_c1_seq1:59-742(-)
MADFLTNRENYDDIDSATEDGLVEGFGSLPRSILSLYEAMTGGKDWDDLAAPLIELNPIYGLIFSIYIAFVTLALGNVVTGVFVESALKSAKDDENRHMLATLKKLFKEIDTDGSNSITWTEFTSKLLTPHFITMLKEIEITPEEAMNLFKLLDADESGDIDQDEFINGFLGLRGAATSFDLSTVMHEARKNQVKNKLNFRKLERVILKLNMKLDKEMSNWRNAEAV